MNSSPTRLTLFVPGPTTLRDVLQGEWIDNPRDGSFAAAFSFGTVDPERVRQIDAAPGALLVELPDDLQEGRARVLRSIEQLRAGGALAMRIEQSKLGWATEQWTERLAAPAPWALHQFAVVVLNGETRVTSCGMHAFSLPDASVALDAETSAKEAQRLVTELNLYQLVEDPLLLSGHTFTPDAKTARRALQRWPDDGYPAEDWCHNPYGVWRLGPAGSRGTPPSELHLQFVPALVALLLAEAKQGPLDRAKVEAIRDRAVCVAVQHRGARTLERARGYADLDPELVWEQWQLVIAGRVA